GRLDGRARAFVFRAQGHLDEVLLDSAQRLDPPQSAVDKALSPVIPQAHQPVAGDRQWFTEALEITHPLIVGAAGAVDPDQHLIGPKDLGRVNGGAWYDARLAVVADAEFAA